MILESVLLPAPTSGIRNVAWNPRHFFSSRSTEDSSDSVEKYRNMFDHIVLVSPSAKTLKDNIFENLEHKFEHLDEEVFETLEDITEDAIETGEQTLIILDDVSSELRKNKSIERQLAQITKNRRHRNTSIICIGHNLIDFAPSLRKNASLIFLFRPKSRREVDLIINEFMMMDVGSARQLMKMVYQDKHDFMLIDMSLRRSGNFEFFRNFNKLELED